MRRIKKYALCVKTFKKRACVTADFPKLPFFHWSHIKGQKHLSIFIQNMIKIKDSALDGIDIQRRLQDKVVQMTSISDLAQTGPKKLHKGEGSLSGNPNSEYTFIELIDNVAIREPEFTSTAPVVGKLIVKIRQVWNWMSTRWYVLPIIQQQSDVNFQMSIILMEMIQQQKSTVQHIAKLETKINALEARLLQ